MDVSQELKDTENALRDFILVVLENTFGGTWLGQCGVSQERIAKWKERKAEESKRQEAGVVEERLLYYADFYDLGTIISKHWALFSDVIGEKKRFEVFFEELKRFRDPDAHRRELLPHQQQLVAGIAGDIRSRLIRARSKMETTIDCFPRIESARDSLGNQWTPSSGSPNLNMVVTNQVLRPGDRLQFVVTARDPEDLKLEYALSKGGSVENWSDENVFDVEIDEADIGKHFTIKALIRSPRSYHARGSYDDKVDFYYLVLPSRTH